MKTLDEIKQANARAGGHFFDAKTLRFWGSRVSERVYPAASGGAFFVTSELDMHRTRRMYTVRFCDASGRVVPTGEFRKHPTRESAHNAARHAASGG